jgi:hypothetical protein
MSDFTDAVQTSLRATAKLTQELADARAENERLRADRDEQFHRCADALAEVETVTRERNDALRANELDAGTIHRLGAEIEGKEHQRRDAVQAELEAKQTEANAIRLYGEARDAHDQTMHDLVAARAEVERLTKERDEQHEAADALRGRVYALTHERHAEKWNEMEAEIERLTKERKEALAWLRERTTELEATYRRNRRDRMWTR